MKSSGFLKVTTIDILNSHYLSTYFTKAMKTLFATALVVLMTMVHSPKAYSGDAWVFINPGFKLGYTFGEQGGFTYGFELSVTTDIIKNQSGGRIGVVFDVDACKDWTRIHTGIEASAVIVGCDIGPSFLFRNDTVSYGFSFIPFAGILLYPYYNFSYFEDGFSTHEIGSYFKLPIRISGENFISLVD